MSDEVTEVVENTPKPTVTRPARAKSASVRRSTEAKKAPKAVSETVDEVDEDVEDEAPAEPIRLVLKQTGETSNYAVFQIPRLGSDGSKNMATGSIYAPKGTRVVKVLIA